MTHAYAPRRDAARSRACCWPANVSHRSCCPGFADGLLTYSTSPAITHRRNVVSGTPICCANGPACTAPSGMSDGTVSGSCGSAGAGVATRRASCASNAATRRSSASRRVDTPLRPSAICAVRFGAERDAGHNASRVLRNASISSSDSSLRRLSPAETLGNSPATVKHLRHFRWFVKPRTVAASVKVCTMVALHLSGNCTTVAQ
jgi:hypothetical protein